MQEHEDIRNVKKKKYRTYLKKILELKYSVKKKEKKRKMLWRISIVE